MFRKMNILFKKLRINLNKKIRLIQSRNAGDVYRIGHLSDREYNCKDCYMK